MEMNLRAQSPLCSRGRPALVVRPAAASTGLTLSVMRCSRFTRGELVRCMVSSSDYPKRNPRRTSTSKSKGVASGGYASRPTAESSTKKIEQSSDDEGDFGRTNGSLYGEATEQASTAEESSQVYFSGDISSGAERDEDGTEDQNQSSVLSSASVDDDSIDRKLDEYRGKISALVSSKPEPSSLASVAGQNKSVDDVHGQEEPITGPQGHDSAIVDAPVKGRPFAEAVVGYKDFITESAAGEPTSENEEEEIVSLEDVVGISADADIQAPVEEDVWQNLLSNVAHMH